MSITWLLQIRRMCNLLLLIALSTLCLIPRALFAQTTISGVDWFPNRRWVNHALAMAGHAVRKADLVN